MCTNDDNDTTTIITHKDRRTRDSRRSPIGRWFFPLDAISKNVYEHDAIKSRSHRQASLSRSRPQNTVTTRTTWHTIPSRLWMQGGTMQPRHRVRWQMPHHSTTGAATMIADGLDRADKEQGLETNASRALRSIFFYITILLTIY